jgi:hypothetical protein
VRRFQPVASADLHKPPRAAHVSVARLGWRAYVNGGPPRAVPIQVGQGSPTLAHATSGGPGSTTPEERPTNGGTASANGRRRRRPGSCLRSTDPTPRPALPFVAHLSEAASSSSRRTQRRPSPGPSANQLWERLLWEPELDKRRGHLLPPKLLSPRCTHTATAVVRPKRPRKPLGACTVAISCRKGRINAKG